MKHTPKEGRTISEEEIKYAEKILDLAKDQKKEKQEYLDSLENKTKVEKKIYKNNLETLKLYD